MYQTKDSGKHKQYDSGMMRDTSEGKPRFDLIQPIMLPYDQTMTYRLAMLLERGARKYSSRNWEKANSPEEMEHALASLGRHYHQYIAGMEDEDHAAAILFNIMEIEYIKWRMKHDL
jgi:hypothetical protein